MFPIHLISAYSIGYSAEMGTAEDELDESSRSDKRNPAYPIWWIQVLQISHLPMNGITQSARSLFQCDDLIRRVIQDLKCLGSGYSLADLTEYSMRSIGHKRHCVVKRNQSKSDSCILIESYQQ